jgi:hypothetical protein
VKSRSFWLENALLVLSHFLIRKSLTTFAKNALGPVEYHRTGCDGAKIVPEQEKSARKCDHFRAFSTPKWRIFAAAQPRELILNRP